jgi:flagellar biosynthesis protein FlhF
MNTGQGSKSSLGSETFPFAADVYRSAEPAARNAEIDELRVEMRNEVRALKTHVTRVSTNAEVTKEIAAIRAAIEELAHPPVPAKRSDRIAALLRARGVEGQPATRIAAKAKESEEAEISGKLKSAIAAFVSFDPWTDEQEGRRIVAMVGPSGVGKTTTVAKLAARARMGGKSVALVSCDGFRVGAVDQLERYADLLGATFHVARTAAELAAVLEEETSDLVFVDTSGRPPTATAPEAALAARRKKDAPVPVDVILCVPASIRHQDAVRVMATFASLAPTKVCVTKLDETEAPSGLVHGPWAAKLPLTVLCTGPRVPEDVTPATLATFMTAFGVEESST